MGMLYSLGNYVNSSTLSSVSSEEDIYPKENMYNKRQSMPWRMTAKSGHAIFDLGADRPMCIGIMNHNLVGSGEFSLELSCDDDPPGWNGQAWGPTSIPYHAQNIFYIIPTAERNRRWWRLDVSDPDNGANLEFGEIILYTWGAFTRNYSYPYEEGLDYVVDESETQYGHRHRAKKAKRKTFALDFEGVEDALLVSEVQAFFEGLDGKDPFIFIPDDAGADSWYVYCLNSMKASRVFLDYNKFSLALEEQSRGISLL